MNRRMKAVLLFATGERLAVEVSDPPPEEVTREFQQFHESDLREVKEDDPIPTHAFKRSFRFQYVNSNGWAVYEEAPS